MKRDHTIQAYNKIKEKYSLIGKSIKGTLVTHAHYYKYVKESCRKDIQLFSLIFLNHYNSFPHNEFHIEAFNLLEQGEKNLALAATRGAAKSSIFSLVGVLHDILYEKEKFILILSNTESQVLSHSNNIIKELSENEKIISVFGILLPRKKNSSSDFFTTTGIRVSARGSASSMRGLRYGANRPTKIILDDVEDDDIVANPVTREKFENWFTKEISFLGTPNKTKYHFIGTILHEESLLSKQQKIPSYKSRTYKMIQNWDNAPELWEEWKKIYVNKDNPKHIEESNYFYEQNKDKMIAGTKVLWPEKESYLDLQKKIIEVGMPSFLQEYQMEAIDLSKVLFPMFYYCGITEKNGLKGILTHHGAFFPIGALTPVMSIDPTAGSKDAAKGDATSIIIGYQQLEASKEDNRLFIVKDWTKNAKPSVWIRQMFIMAEEWNVEKIVIEENLYRNFLKENLLDAHTKLKEEGVLKKQPPVIKEILSSVNKEKRITQLEPKISSGKIQFDKSALTTEFWQQLKNYIPNGKCKDDVPDSLNILWDATRSFTGVAVINLDPSQQQTVSLNRKSLRDRLEAEMLF